MHGLCVVLADIDRPGLVGPEVFEGRILRVDILVIHRRERPAVAGPDVGEFVRIGEIERMHHEGA